MTAAQRRKAVEVARDVIAQLRAKRLIASCGGYLAVQDYDPETDTYLLNTTKEKSFQKIFQQNKGITCEVCAIGAMYVSFINRFNGVTKANLSHDGDEMTRTLAGVFTEDQLRLMEAAFEGYWITGFMPDWYYDLDHGDDDDHWGETPKQARIDNAIHDYFRKYDTDDQRLRAIMLNVVRNNGEFRLPLRVR